MSTIKLMCVVLAGLFIFQLQAIDFKDTFDTPVPYNKKILTRSIVASQKGGVGFIYRYKKENGKRVPLSARKGWMLGMLAPGNWYHNGFFRIYVNRRHILIGAPVLEDIIKVVNNTDKEAEMISVMNTKYGELHIRIRFKADRNYADVKLSFPKPKMKINSLRYEFLCFPDHCRKDKPYLRCMLTGDKNIELKARQNVDLTPAKNDWLVFYDKGYQSYGPCGMMFDPDQTATVKVLPDRRNYGIFTSVTLKPDTNSANFLFWHVPKSAHSANSLSKYIKGNSSTLLKEMRASSKSTANTAKKNVFALNRLIPVYRFTSGQNWESVKWSEGFYYLHSKKPVNPTTQFKILRDAKNLYLKIRCQEPQMDKIVFKCKKRDAHVYGDDSVEIFIAPAGLSKDYYHFIVNSGGIVFDQKTNAATNSRPGWNAAVKSRTAKDTKSWTVTLTIPVKDINLLPKQSVILLNIARTRRLTKGGPKGIKRHSSWSPILHGGYNTPMAFGVLSSEKSIAGKSFKDKVVAAFGNPDFFSCEPVRKTVYICQKLALPTYINLKDNRLEFSKYLYYPPLKILRSQKYKDYMNGLKICIQLPKSCSLADEKEIGDGGSFSIKKLKNNTYEFTPIMDGRKGSRYGLYIRSFISFPLFVKSSGPAGTAGNMIVWTKSTMNGKTFTTARKKFPVKIIKFPKTPQLKKFIISMWPNPTNIFYWPDYISSLKKSGFNSFDCRIPWYTGNNQKIKRQAAKLLREARKSGLKISLQDSTFGRFKNSKDGRWGNSKHPDPTYRGEGYQKDINAVKTAVKIIRPDYFLMDCEFFREAMENKDLLYSNKKFTEDRKKSGLTLKQQLTATGDDIAGDIKKTLTESSKKRVLFGFYGTGMYLSQEHEHFPGNEFFEGIYNIKSLLKKDLSDFAMPDTYHDGNMEYMLKKIGAVAVKLKTNKILPWEAAGWHVGLPLEMIRDQFLETIAFGCRGVAYWRPAAWDVGAYLYHAYAIKEAAPFEDIFYDGKPFMQTKLGSDYHIKGVKLNDEAIILVSRYKKIGNITVSVNNPLKKETQVWDRISNTLLGKVKANGSIKVSITKRNTKLLYLGSKFKARTGIK
jgi:Carbohydrate family 9 binding domain-like